MHEETVIAREWLERGNKATSSIDAFTDYWRGFNNLYAAARNRDAERNNIRRYLGQTVQEHVAREIITVDFKALEYLLSCPVIDMRGAGRDTLPAIETFIATLAPKVKLAELFMIIYQVRCNLEHGDKSPTVDRDIALCRACAPFVAAVVDRFA